MAKIKTKVIICRAAMFSTTLPRHYLRLIPSIPCQDLRHPLPFQDRTLPRLPPDQIRPKSSTLGLQVATNSFSQARLTATTLCRVSVAIPPPMISSCLGLCRSTWLTSSPTRQPINYFIVATRCSRATGSTRLLHCSHRTDSTTKDIDSPVSPQSYPRPAPRAHNPSPARPSRTRVRWASTAIRRPDHAPR